MSRTISTLALPGDADAVVAWEVARAIHRDARLNKDEMRTLFRVNWCQEARLKYPYMWVCARMRPCCYCEEIYDPLPMNG